jgi:uncharacterized membrane protein YfhO
VVFSEIDYPGWVAEVDGASTPVLTADYMLRAVWVDPGDHQLTMTYRPGSALLGAVLSGLTLAGLGAWAVFWVRRRRRVSDWARQPETGLSHANIATSPAYPNPEVRIDS